MFRSQEREKPKNKIGKDSQIIDCVPFVSDSVQNFIPDVESLGRFAEIQYHPHIEGWLRKSIQELLLSPDRSIQRYTAEEYHKYIELPLQIMSTSSVLQRSLPLIKTSFNAGKAHPISGLEFGTATMDMEIVQGTAVEELQDISPEVMNQIDEIIFASLQLDILIGVVDENTGMRVRPDILSNDLRIQSFIFGTTASRPHEQVYLIDVYPAYYYDYQGRDFELEHWEAAFDEIESRATCGSFLRKSRHILRSYFEQRVGTQIA